MIAKGASFRCLCLGLGLMLTVEALDLSSFSGQASTKLLIESVVGIETTPQAREMLLQVKEDSPDYTCTATKRCDLGCCGPL
jgi:chitinase